MKNIRICLILALCLTLFAACANDDPIYGLGAQSTEVQTYPTDPDVTVNDVLPDIPATEPLTTEEATTEEDTHVCTEDWGIAVPEKPVIYLYPTEPTVCDVRVLFDGELTFTYPAHGTLGWQNFTAYPDGTLTFPDGKEYYCLFWEGVSDTVYDFSRGFCVKGEDTAAFLEWALAAQGLSARETNEFIIYWLPRMQHNAYNLISFQTDAYTESAALEISPAPDSLLRVFMAFVPLDAPVEIEPQELVPFEREGFCVVEWGGALVASPRH